MKLLLKFNLIFIFAFGVGLLVAAGVSHWIVLSNAKEEVLQQARLMMETAMSTRTYTSSQIAPLLNTQRTQLQALRRQFEQSVQPDAEPSAAPDVAGLTGDQAVAVQKAIQAATDAERQKVIDAFKALPQDNPKEAFNPQTVPAYAATENFSYLRQKYPEYSYKEATLNPTNLRDRTTDWEADIVNNFRNNDKLTELYGTRSTATGDALYLARPITIGAASCLECHSTPDQAPPAMTKLYGSDNGFGWKLHETVGAQLVQVPMALPVQMGNQAFRTLLGSLIGVFLLTLIILNVVLQLTVIKPVAKLSTMADEVSAGKLDVPEVPVKGKDEISVLATAFNRMQRSLVKALKLLEE